MSDSKDNHKIWGELSKNENTSSENNDEQHLFQPIDENFFELEYPIYESDHEKDGILLNKESLSGSDSNSDSKSKRAEIEKKQKNEKQDEKGVREKEKTSQRKDKTEERSSEATSVEDDDEDVVLVNNSLLHMSNEHVQSDAGKEEAQKPVVANFKQAELEVNRPNKFASMLGEESKMEKKTDLIEAQYKDEIIKLENIIKELKKEISDFNGFKVELDLSLENNLMLIVEYEAREITLRNELDEVKEALRQAKECGRNNFIERRFSFGGKSDMPFTLETNCKPGSDNGIPSELDEEVRQLKEKLDERENEIKKLKQAIEKLSLEKFEEAKRIQTNFEQEIKDKNSKLESMQQMLDKYNSEIKLSSAAVRPSLEKKILEKDLELHNLAISREREKAERDLEIKRLNQMLDKIKSERSEELSLKEKTIERLKGEKEADIKRLHDKFTVDMRRQCEEDKKKFSDLIAKQREALESKLKSLSLLVSQSLETLAKKETDLRKCLQEIAANSKAEYASPKFKEIELAKKRRKKLQRNDSNSSNNSNSSGEENIVALKSKLEEQEETWNRARDELQEELEEKNSIIDTLKRDISNLESRTATMTAEIEKAKAEKKKFSGLLEKKIAELNQFKEEMSARNSLDNIEELISTIMTFSDSILGQEAEMPENLEPNLLKELKFKLTDLINFLDPEVIPKSTEIQVNLMESLKRSQEVEVNPQIINNLETQLQEALHRESQNREVYQKDCQLKDAKLKELETEFSQDLRRIRENLRQVELANGSLMAEINMLRLENERFAIKIQQDGAQLKEREKKFSQELKALREKLGLEEKKNSSLTDEIRSLREENEKLAMKKLLDSSEESQKELQLRKELKDQQERLKTEELRNENINSELIALRSSNDKLKSRLVQYQEFYENGRQENIQLGKMLESRTNENNELNERLKTETEYSQLILSEIEVLNHIEAHLRNDKKETEDHGAFDGEESDEQDTERQMKPSSKDLSIMFCIPQTENLKQKILIFINERRDLWRKITALMKKIEEISKDGDERVESYKRELDEKYSLIDYLKRNEEELHLEIQSLKQEVKRKASKIQEKEQMSSYLNGEISKKDERIRQLISDLNLLQRDLGDCVVKSKEVESVRAVLKDVFDKKAKQFEDSDNYYKNVIKGKEEIINELTSELRDKSMSYEQKLKKIEDQVAFLENKNMLMKESADKFGDFSRFAMNKDKFSSVNEKVFSSVDSEPVSSREELQRFLNQANRTERDMTPPTKGLKEVQNSLSSSTTERINIDGLASGRAGRGDSIDQILKDIDNIEKNLENLTKNFYFVVKFLELELQNGGINEARFLQIKKNYHVLLNNNDQTKISLTDALRVLKEKIMKLSNISLAQAPSSSQSPYNSNFSQSNLQQSNVIREEKTFSKSQIPSAYQEPSTKLHSPMSSSYSNIQLQTRSISPLSAKLQLPTNRINNANNQPMIKTERAPITYQEPETNFFERGNKTPQSYQEKRSDAGKASGYLARRYNKTAINQDEIGKNSTSNSVSIKLYQKKKK